MKRWLAALLVALSLFAPAVHAACLQDWSSTAANNTDVGSIDWAEGMSPGSVNDSARAMMADVAKWRDDTSGALTTAGGTTAYTLTTNCTFTAYADGMRLSVVANATNTGASTLNVDSVGAKALRKVTSSGEVALAAGDIKQAGHYILQYDASANSAAGAWIVLNPTPGSSGDFAGPASSTDNAIVRFDGTGGKTGQNSGVTIDDSDNVTGVGTLTTTGAITSGGNVGVTGTVTASGNINSSSGEVQENGVAISPIGSQTIWVPAGAMVARTTNGCAEGSTETTTNKVMLKTCDFDASTGEFAQFTIAMPTGWNEGTLTAQFFWKHASTTTNFGVVWQIRCVSLSNDDAGDTAFGDLQSMPDTGGTTNDIYVTSVTAAITCAGTPAAGDLTSFEVIRGAANGSDTLAIDAGLLGVKLIYTTSAATDD